MKNKHKQSENQPAQWHTLSDDLINLSTEKGNSQPEQEVRRFPQAYCSDSSQGCMLENGMPGQGSTRDMDTIGMTKNWHTDYSQYRDNFQNEKIPNIRKEKKRRWPVVLAVAMAILLISGGIFSYFYVHLWADATCTTPKTCRICGWTVGNSLGHRWTKNDCVSPKNCSVCGEVSNQAAGHTWIPATCTTPKTCSVCGITQGGTASHSITTDTYADYGHDKVETEQICSVCGCVVGYSQEELTTLLDSRHQRFLLSPADFLQRIYYSQPAFDMLDSLQFDLGQADMSQIGDAAAKIELPLIITISDGSEMRGCIYFLNRHGDAVTENDAGKGGTFDMVSLVLNEQDASSKYAQIPQMLISVCDPTMDERSIDTLMLAMTAFSGEGGVEHNGIFYSRVGGLFQATCAGALN